MKIGVLGTGVVGQTIAERLLELGHDIMIGTRNVNEALSRKGTTNMGMPAFGDWIGKFPGLKVGTQTEAASFGKMVVNATSGLGALNALQSAGAENLKAKVLLDISNPLDFSNGFPPTLSVCNTDSLGEQIQRAFPETMVVKTLNTMTAAVMARPSLVPGDHNVFISGDEETAKDEVKSLLHSFGWKPNNIIDLGDITTARGTEQLLPVWVRLYGKLQNPMFNFKVVTA